MNQIKEEGHYFDDFTTYGGFDARHAWADPKEDEASALYLDANFEKAFKIDDMSSVFHYELIAENGGLNSYMTGERKSEIVCSDGMLHEDDRTSLPLAVSTSHASEDHYLDVDFAKKVPDLDYKFCDELGFEELGVVRAGNFSSEIHSPGTSNDEVGVSESSLLVPQCFSHHSENITTDEMHDDSGSTCRYERSVDDKVCSNSSITCDTHSAQENNDDRSTLETGSSFDHDGKKLPFSLTSVVAPCFSICALDEFGHISQRTKAQDCSVDDLSTDSCAETIMVKTRQRRMCRPPQRYLDGSQWLQSRLQKAKKHPNSLLKDAGVRSQKKKHRKALKRKASREQTNDLEFDSDEEYEPDPSDFKPRILKKNRYDRRKHSQPWTLDEVVALVEGMSQFGIGQWTAVKRNFFSSSRRTATDVRDKWRNLVKTNCKSLKRRKDDQQVRSGSQPLPNSVIERVRELANAPAQKSRGKLGRKHSESRCCDLSPSLAEQDGSVGQLETTFVE